MIGRAALERLRSRARRDVDSGLLPSVQIALGHRGEILHEEAFGDATPDSAYVVFSATKPIVAGVAWALIGEGSLDVRRPVADFVPEFAADARAEVTVEHLMLHTAGLARAYLSPIDGDTSARRRRAFETWIPAHRSGTQFEYHPTSAHWVLAEVIEVLTGQDFRDAVEDVVTEPLGLPRLLGSASRQAATLVEVGDPASAADLMDAFGVAELDKGEVTPAHLLAFNDPAVQVIGTPGGGGVASAADLALFYQAVLHDRQGVWRPEVLEDVRSHVRNDLPDPLMGVSAKRTLGLIQAGDDGWSHFRGFGRTVSARAIGHNGAAGQIAWGDPQSGLSFGYCTNGIDMNDVREARRTTALSSLAGLCVT